MNYGDYPKEYKPEVHGPYDPARFYGKPDTPFGQVKLTDLCQWFSRREMNPRALAGVTSRAYWRWQHKYFQPKYHGAAPFYQLIVGFMIFGYVINYHRITMHRHHKYH